MEATKKPAQKEHVLTLKERLNIIRESRYFLMVFPFAMLAVIVLVFTAATQGQFFRMSVFTSIFSQAVIIGTCATGVSFIYSNGNLDISIGSVLGLSATLGVMVFTATGNAALMIIVMILAALLLMAFNCTMSVVCHIKTITVAIVVTQIYGAISTLLIGGTGSIDIDYNVAVQLEDGGFRYISFILYFVFCIVLYHLTRVGRELRFLGGNENCAVQTGISNARATYISFLVTGLGVETGNNLGMDVMLATVLGGMSIFGGARSNAYAGILGALTVAALNTGLLMAGVSSAWIQGIRGIIFLILVWMNSERQALLPSRVQF